MANRNWIGSASAVKDVWTITVADTWATSDTVTITIGSSTLVITIGSLTSTAQVATTIQQAFESTAFTDTSASCVPSGGGTTIPEFAAITASVASSVVTLTADAAGVPHTVSVAESTVGSGTATESHATSATGPNFWDNVGNWLEGSVPTTGDDVYIDRPVAILYGLDQNSVTLASMTIGERFSTSAYIGLTSRNAAGYAEYRDQYLKIGVTSLVCRGNSSRMRINFGSVQTTATIFSTGSSSTTGISALQLLGTHASNTLRVTSGSVGVAENDGEVSTVATITQEGGSLNLGNGNTLTNVTKIAGTLALGSSTTTLKSYSGTTTVRGGTQAAITLGGGELSVTGTTTVTALRQQGGTATIGPNCTATTLDKAAGTLVSYVGCTTLTSDSGAVTVHDGSITTANISTNSVFNYGGSGTIGTLNTTSGESSPTLNFDLNTSAACTVTTLSVTGAVDIYDTAKRVTWTNGLPSSPRRMTVAV